MFIRRSWIVRLDCPAFLATFNTFLSRSFYPGTGFFSKLTSTGVATQWLLVYKCASFYGKLTQYPYEGIVWLEINYLPNLPDERQ